MKNSQVSPAATTTFKAPVAKTFNSKNQEVHAEKLIRELAIAKNGFFSEELGKRKAIELCSHLNEFRARCVASKMTQVIKSKFFVEGETIMKDKAVRKGLAELYPNCPEVAKLCEIERASKQIACIKVILKKVNTRIFPTKKQIAKNQEILLNEANLGLIAETMDGLENDISSIPSFKKQIEVLQIPTEIVTVEANIELEDAVADSNANLVYNTNNVNDIIALKAEEIEALIIAGEDVGASALTMIKLEGEIDEENAYSAVVQPEMVRQRIDLPNGNFYLKSACGNQVLFIEKEEYFTALKNVARKQNTVATITVTENC